MKHGSAALPGDEPAPPPRRADPSSLYAPIHPVTEPDRFVAPQLDKPPARRPLPVRGLALTLVLVLLAGVGLGVAYVRLRPAVSDPDVIVRPSGTSSEETGLASPQEVVRQYFTALQDGDIERALALGPRGGAGSEALLTSAAYSRTHELSPISELNILTKDDSATEVRVTYRLGEHTVESTVRVVRLDNGTYRLARTTITVQFELVGGERVPMLINGTEVNHAQTIELVPGRYELATGLPFLDYPDTNHFTVESLSGGDARVTPVTPELTDEGRDAFNAAVKASLDACLSQRTLAPEGCPFKIGARRAVDESSIEWSLLNDPWARSTPILSTEDQSVAQVSLTLQTSVNFRYSDGGSSGNNPVTVTALATARVLGGQASQLSVTWIS